ncbi:DUF2634 domain-containing protein [Lachnospiraceae bacterium NSJ-143]|nr:DUF2634 domain-containing protein [Lachnospiraceae bacterium NSJ-143]
MIPKYNEDFISVFKKHKEPSRTYEMDTDRKLIRGFCDGVDSVKQAVYKILKTERYDWLIYSFNYGVELKELFGKQMTYVTPKIKSRISEALVQDDRIKEVKDFSFEKKKNTLSVEFTVVSTEGSFESGVEINV